jgi:uncharacterized membrane protein (DUF2068 family)
MTAPTRKSVADRTAFLRVVAIYKFVQAIGLVGLGLATMRLIRPEVAAKFEQWVQDRPIGMVQNLGESFLTWISGTQSNRLLFLGIALFVYAGLFLVEAVGLWMQRRWAEWLTIVATGLLIPPELYECFTRPKPLVFMILLGNVVIVWLLVVRLRHELRRERVTR